MQPPVSRESAKIAKMIATDISAIILIAISAVFFGYEVRFLDLPSNFDL